MLQFELRSPLMHLFSVKRIHEAQYWRCVHSCDV